MSKKQSIYVTNYQLLILIDGLGEELYHYNRRLGDREYMLSRDGGDSAIEVLEGKKRVLEETMGKLLKEKEKRRLEYPDNWNNYSDF